MRPILQPIALLLASLIAFPAAAQTQQTGHHAAPPTKQLNAIAARNAKQALDMTAVPTALPPQPIIPGADATMPGLSQPSLYDNPAPAGPLLNNSRPYDPGSIHYPYGRASLGNVDPASRANPYGPYSSTQDSNTAYGHYSGPTPPQTPNTLLGNPAPAFAPPSPNFGVNNTPAFSRGR